MKGNITVKQHMEVFSYIKHITTITIMITTLTMDNRIIKKIKSMTFVRMDLFVVCLILMMKALTFVNWHYLHKGFVIGTAVPTGT